jgi:cytochrome c oxidase assembly protein subunit 11
VGARCQDDDQGWVFASVDLVLSQRERFCAASKPTVDPSLVRAIAREQGKTVEQVEKELTGKVEELGKDHANADAMMYLLSGVIFMLGMSYAAVPLYQAFCQATGYGGTVQISKEETFKTMRPVPGAKPVTVRFEASTSDNMPWEFRPQQRAIRVVPGETALAFYSAYNPTDKPITGVSTYNVTPMRSGVHFNKIQCFCFEEQRLRPGEEIDMPLFFFIDPDFCDDPSMEDVREITLSYTFFRTGDVAKETLDLAGQTPAQDGATRHDVQAWTDATAARLGVSREPTDR